MATIQRRSYKSGATSYQVRVSPQGHPPHFESFGRLADAKTWATKVEREIKLGECAICSPVADATLSQVFDGYLACPAFQELKPNSKSDARESLKYLERDWGPNKLVSSLSPQFIHKYQEQRDREGVGGSRINRLVTYLNVALQYAKRMGLIRANPIAGYERVKENARRQRVMTPQEYESLKKVMPAHLVPLFELCSRLPLRKTEATNLTWDMIDLDAKCIRFPEGMTKSGRRRVVPLSLHPDLVPMLAQLPSRDKGGLVFTWPSGRPLGDFKRAWDKTLVKAKIDDLRFHDLKRTAVTNLKLRGVPEFVIQHMADHATPIMTDSYTVIEQEHVLAAVAQLGKGLTLGDGYAARTLP